MQNVGQSLELINPMFDKLVRFFRGDQESVEIEAQTRREVGEKVDEALGLAAVAMKESARAIEDKDVAMMLRAQVALMLRKKDFDDRKRL